jgi:steroid delta-isomerase-like uncharacterized protein
MTTADSKPPSLDESFVQEATQRALEAYNAQDADRFAALMTEDVIVDHSAAPTTMHGLAEVLSFYTDSWKAFPDARLELVDGPFLHPNAPRTSVVWRWIGTNTGPIDPPGFAATGKRVEVPVCEVVEFRDGLVCRFRVVIDMADLMRQLGLLAAPGSRTERAMAALQRLQMKLSRRR